MPGMAHLKGTQKRRMNFIWVDQTVFQAVNGEA